MNFDNPLTIYMEVDRGTNPAQVRLISYLDKEGNAHIVDGDTSFNLTTHDSRDLYNWSESAGPVEGNLPRPLTEDEKVAFRLMCGE